MAEKTSENSEGELQKCQKEREEYLAGWQRAKADFLNLEKEETKRWAEVIKFANEELLKELILILDSFALAVKSGDEKAAIIQGQLTAILRSRGLEKLPVNIGERFNPLNHEVVSEAAAGEPGTILEVIGNGYTLNGKVVRPAKVKVAK